MNKYAVMPKEDYVAICDAIRDKKETSETFKSGNLPREIGKVYDKGYNEGFVDGEEQGYDDGYVNGWDFGESSGTHDGFEVGVGYEEDTKSVVCFSGYQSGDFSGSFGIPLDYPKKLIVTVSERCVFGAFELTDAEGTTHTFNVSQLDAGTHTFDILDDFVCNADDGYGEIYLEGQCSDYGIVGVSVTNKMDYAEGVEQGKKDRDLEWWRVYQDVSGENAGWCHYQFAGAAWNKETFKPKFDIKNNAPNGPGNANSLFQNHNNDGEPYDLVEHLESLGVKLDFSTFSAAVNAFNAAKISRLPSIDITVMGGSYNTSSIFASKYIETIDEVVCCERTFDYYNNEFNGATALKNITIKGVIANNKLNFSPCPLTHDSLMSIINQLTDFSGTGETRSITFGSTNLAKLTDAEKQIATGKGWTLA